jgi:hypothetical protein
MAMMALKLQQRNTKRSSSVGPSYQKLPNRCLNTRGMLPADIIPAMQELISKHSACRCWFENLRHRPRLAFLAMHTTVNNMMGKATMQDRIDLMSGFVDSSSSVLSSLASTTTKEAPPLMLYDIYSAHNLTQLIGLPCCTFRME